jgi:hypothetical protein
VPTLALEVDPRALLGVGQGVHRKPLPRLGVCHPTAGVSIPVRTDLHSKILNSQILGPP